MKTFILSLILVCNLLAVTAEDAAWLLNAQTDFGKALKKAEHEKKTNGRPSGGEGRM